MADLQHGFGVIRIGSGVFAQFDSLASEAAEKSAICPSVISPSATSFWVVFFQLCGENRFQVVFAVLLFR